MLDVQFDLYTSILFQPFYALVKNYCFHNSYQSACSQWKMARFNENQNEIKKFFKGLIDIQIPCGKIYVRIARNIKISHNLTQNWKNKIYF